MTYATEEPLGVAAELLSLALILASFLVVSYLSYKTRSRKTFQFEILVFTVVLVAAEVPRTLYSLGVVDIDALSTYGLAIHSLSMVILSFFVAVRIKGFFSGSKIRGKDFVGIVQGAVESGISEAIGETEMKSVSFYVRSELAAMNPEAYSRSIEKIFGTGSPALTGPIVRSICLATGLQAKAGQDLPSTVESARQKFLSAGSPIRP